MASSVVIAKRYAKALMSVCQGVEGAKSALPVLSQLALAARNSDEFSNLLRSPEFSGLEKWNVVKSLAEKFSATEQVLKFLKVLTLNGRAQVLPELEEVFKEKVLEMDASVEGHVDTAVLLSDAQLAEMAAVLSKAVGKRVKLSQKLVPDLIAGIRVNILGKTLDASFASNLELVHRELLVAQA